MTTTINQLDCRLAGTWDLMDLQSLMSRMLHELAPLGHPVLPNERNLVIYTDMVFAPALESGQHGIAIAYDGPTPIGAAFFTPEQTVFEMQPGRAISHGIYVHPEWRHSRVALQLLHLAKRRLKELGYTTLVNYVLVANKGGNALSRYLRSRTNATETLTQL